MSKINLGSQSISGDSEGFGDYRYQKALKEISKLINVNRQIKLQSERHRQQSEQAQNNLQQVMHQNAVLENNIQLLSNEYQNLSREYEKLSQEYVVLEDYCKKAEFEQRQVMENSQLQTQENEQLHRQHLEEIEELSGRFHGQMTELTQELHRKEQLIEDMQTKMGEFTQLQYSLRDVQSKLHKQNASLKEENASLKQQNNSMKEQLSQLGQQVSSLHQKLSNKKPDEELANKLRINEDWIKSLNDQNYNLKQRLLEQEYKNQKEKCSQTIFNDMFKANQSLSNLHHSPNELLIKEYLKQAQKKLKKIEQEKNKLNEKCLKLKTANTELIAKNNSLQKEVNVLVVKVKGYEELTERQQKEIEVMIEEYHREMDKMMLKSNLSRRSVSSHELLSVTQEQGEKSNHIEKEKQQQLHMTIDVLSQKLQNLQKQISRLHGESQQQLSLIRYLQEKVAAMQQERAQIISTNQQLEKALSYQNLSIVNGEVTSPNIHKTPTTHQSLPPSIQIQNLTLLKTHSVNKNGNKVFEINGKKYQTVVLKNTQNHPKQEPLHLHKTIRPISSPNRQPINAQRA